MNRIRKKLASDRGASITFALLLFLVCAVVSSIVIVAATTASGRMSKLADMDQRYFAVNSAAQLLVDTLEMYGNDYLVTESPNEDNPDEMDVKVSLRNDPDTSLITPFSIPSREIVSNEEIRKYEDTLTLTITDIPNAKLNCKIDVNLEDDKLYFTVKNDDGRFVYTIILTFIATIEDASEESDVIEGIKKTAVSWRLEDVKIPSGLSDNGSELVGG